MPSPSPTAPLPIWFAAAALALAGGCASPPAPAPAPPAADVKYSQENDRNFVVLNPLTPAVVTCSNLLVRRQADGRLDVLANVTSGAARPIRLQVQCVFKNPEGHSLGDETPWQNLLLAPGAAETVHFVAAGNLAARFAIRVQPAPNPPSS